MVVLITSFVSFAQEETQEELLEKRNQLQQNFLSLYDQERYQQSILTASEILNITQEIYGPKSQNLVNPLNNLASSYFMIGDYDQAIKLFLECIDLIESKNNWGWAIPQNANNSNSGISESTSLPSKYIFN